MYKAIQMLRSFSYNDLLVLIFGESGRKIMWIFYFYFLSLNKTNVLHLIQTFYFSNKYFRVIDASDQLISIANEIQKHMIDKIFFPW